MPRLQSLSPIARTLLTVAISVLGTVLFQALGFPLPFLFGPMFASLLAALTGIPLRGAGQISIGARTILGVAVGATITPAVLGQVPQMLASVALIPLYVLAIGLVGVPFFFRIRKFDKVTAYYAAMPGGLQDMVVFGQEAGGDVRALSLVHTTRVLVIVSLAPLILTQSMGIGLTNPVGAPAASLPTAELGIMVLAGLAKPLDGILAFSPGAQAEMTVLAIIVGADLGYVTIHHLTRLVIVITGAPILAALLKIR